MRAVTAFGAIPDSLLAPLGSAPDHAWSAAPPGAWSPGQIVAHVAVSIGASARGLAARAEKPAMTRRPRTLFQVSAWHVIRTTGWFAIPFRAPEGTRPEARPDRAATEAMLREGVAHFERVAAALLPRRAHDLFLKHPVLGDLAIEEWSRFHVVHTRHHLRQLIRRLRWTDAKGAKGLRGQG